MNLVFPNNRVLPVLYGVDDRNLIRLEQKLKMSIHYRGNQVTLDGPKTACAQARKILETLYQRLESGYDLSDDDLEDILSWASGGDCDLFGRLTEGFETPKRRITSRGPGQQSYFRALQEKTLVFADGPAGCGKTYIAVAAAVKALTGGQVQRIVLTRPAVEAGERLGFLPGAMKEKIDPYLRPIYDALDDMLPFEQLQRALDQGMIEIAPLAYMRGRNLRDAFIILDEAQNTTPLQMKMFLTRLGRDSRMVVSGDLSQIDLPSGQKSGLSDAIHTLCDIPDIAICRLSAADIVRHPLVAAITEAYNQKAYPEKAKQQPMQKDPKDAMPEDAGLIIETNVVAGRWPKALLSLVEPCLRAAYGWCQQHQVADLPATASLSIALMDDKMIQNLNQQWRGKDRPTNVLSFPANPETANPEIANPEAAGHPSLAGDPETELGDICLSLQRIRAEARQENKSVQDHFQHLLVHGLLHLLGEDHQTEAEALKMESMERAILARQNIPDPYKDEAKSLKLGEVVSLQQADLPQ